VRGCGELNVAKTGIEYVKGKGNHTEYQNPL
jgi:hypothetical protein